MVVTKAYANSFFRTGYLGPANLYVKSKTRSTERFEASEPDRLMDGFLVMSGWDQSIQNYAAWLSDRQGNVLHRWTIDYNLLDPDADKDTSFPHGLEVLADGSLIVNFDKDKVLGRIDSCSRPVWVKQGYFHHNIGKAEDGSLWTWEGEESAYGQQQYLVNFNPETGETISRISLIDDIIAKMGPRAVIFGVRPDFEATTITSDPGEEWEGDIFHPNDIDVLHSDVSDNFKQFQAGDLLISLRAINLIAVIEPETKEVKWWSHGPWRAQHDPDFTSDGKISVYNNGGGSGRSEILKIDPDTRQVDNESFYGTLSFHSETMGTHQYLPNGNLLIVIPEEGRLVEVSEKGDLLFEFNNRVSEEFNARLLNAIWLAPTFFKKMPSC